jgi:hypothetical protein
MADSHLSPAQKSAQKRALDSLQRNVETTAEDTKRVKKPVEQKVKYVEMARRKAASPPTHI